MSDSGNNPPPGWHPDGQGGQRWWDGTQWGPEGQPPPAPPEPEASPPTMAMPTSPPPPYAPPPYAAAPGFPPPGQGPTGAAASGKNTKLLLGIIGGVVGLVVLVIVLVLVLGGGNGPSSDDPAETVASFFDAADDGDCEAADALLTDNARTSIGGGVTECEATGPSEAFGEDVSIDIGKARIDGDDATVPVNLVDESGDLESVGLSEFTLDFKLRKQDGAWLIDDLGFDSLFENLPDLTDLPDLSDLPDPSDFPDDPFSDLPSDLFSDFPSDFPTDLFSDFPSDFDPEDFMSDFPSDLFSDQPTG